MRLFFMLWGVVIVTLLYSSLVEYLVHRYLDHRRFKMFGRTPKIADQLFISHLKVHHAHYTSKQSYVYHGDVHPMTPFSFDLLVWGHIAVVPLYLIGWYVIGWAAVIAGATYVTFHYVVLYSLLHYTMHHPTGRWWERSSIFTAANAHHWLHHRHQNRNFSFTFPVWDYVLGTKAFPTPAERAEFSVLAAQQAAPLPAHLPAVTPSKGVKRALHSEVRQEPAGSSPPPRRSTSPTANS